MASQYRTHLFTVFICADRARLLRRDRAGVTVTRSFQYSSSDTPYLQEFFWRLSHADDATRGWDTSVMDPSPDEEAKARQSLKLDDSEMLFKFALYDDCDPDADPTYLIAGPPFETHAFPTGRATRCFVAYHLTEGRNVFMKDTWRIVTPGLVAEGRVYERLRDSEIPHVAEFIVAGDIPGQTHRTFSRPQQRLHQHYRLVLGTIGRPLTSFRSSWEMLNAIKDGMIAHQQAFQKLLILHQDISVGNVLIMEDSNGTTSRILIDWDLCQMLDKCSSDARPKERIGTWQFISAKLLLDPTGPHTVADDLESFLHVLTWVAILFTPNSMSPEDLTAIIQLCYEDIWGAPDTTLGGRAKQLALATESGSVRLFCLESPILNHLLSTFYPAFGALYGSDLYAMTLEMDPLAAQKMLDRLQDHKWMLTMITNALQDRNAWPAEDASRLNSTFSSGCEPYNRKRKPESELEYCRTPQKYT
ncbi:hypothetical protein IW261DRAFT_1026447 [Armillaria novae-zelandiae]|uniref:Fungal-type protein kinase domain-containing protein n=1 Tax=Armillaria novae-zelandiae TaxID=153914 RepID=A0AA39UK82_9AGAR|nr:hypothetical protein IW261DRAFT_1026447 [Armillaria novae-zelandiae]